MVGVVPSTLFTVWLGVRLGLFSFILCSACGVRSSIFRSLRGNQRHVIRLDFDLKTDTIRDGVSVMTSPLYLYSMGFIANFLPLCGRGVKYFMPNSCLGPRHNAVIMHKGLHP